MTTIYTLELENGKYYVGRSNKPNNRIIAHFNENGSEWTKLYKPIRIISQIKGDEFDEEKYTLIAMNQYGVDNVRGGSYCKTKLSQYDKEKATQTINSIMDKCYKCGKKGHFSNGCPSNEDNVKKEEISPSPIRELLEKGKPEVENEICCACFGSGTSYWSDDIYGSCLECCCINCEKFHMNCTCYYDSHKIRIKLGQTLFPKPQLPQECEKNDLNEKLMRKCNDCENCIYKEWYSEVWKKDGHLRFDYDAQQNFQQNKYIVELFEDLYEGKNVIVHAIKGRLTVYVVLSSYYESSYWGSYKEELIRYEKKYEYCNGEGTVEMIQDIIYQANTC